MIGWYVHHHGRGHLARAVAVRAQLDEAVVVLSSLPEPVDSPFAGWVQLDRDDGAGENRDPSAGGRLHWVPVGHEGLARRNATIAQWIARHRPRLVVVDVSVEVTMLARLCGVPVVVVAGPGEREDAAHQLAYDVADRIVAAWPRTVYDPVFLHRHAAKTTYVGAFSRFDDCTASPAADDRVLVLNGGGGTNVTVADVAAAQAATPDLRWTSVGLPGQPWSSDIWTGLTRAAVVVTHAGQNALADVAAAGRPAVVVPQDRPFAEQTSVAAALGAAGIAVATPHWPRADEWPALIAAARTLGGAGWARWSSGDGATHAARVIRDTAARLRPEGDGPRPDRQLAAPARVLRRAG